MPLDTSETQKLLDAIRKFDTDVRSQASAVLVKGAVEIKKNLQTEARKSKHFGQVAKSISYETTRRRDTTEIEIGPDKERAYAGGRPGRPNKPGPIANIAYFGGANGGGGSLDFDEPVERELTVIDEHLKKLGEAL